MVAALKRKFDENIEKYRLFRAPESTRQRFRNGLAPDA